MLCRGVERRYGEKNVVVEERMLCAKRESVWVGVKEEIVYFFIYFFFK